MRDGLILSECEMASPAASYDIDIEPDDTLMSDTVTVVWQIAS